MFAQSTQRKEVDEFDDLVISKAVKAGRRTYFFDVKSTRNNDYFLTITESRKITNQDGSATFDRHKIFLYKEDFAKFTNELQGVIDFIKQEKPDFFKEQESKSLDAEFEQL